MWGGEAGPQSGCMGLGNLAVGEPYKYYFPLLSPPNFSTCGEPKGLDAMASRAAFGLHGGDSASVS